LLALLRSAGRHIAPGIRAAWRGTLLTSFASVHADTQRNQSDMAPQLGATFVPGGFDDYYMPEVVAPSPQR